MESHRLTFPKHAAKATFAHVAEIKRYTTTTSSFGKKKANNLLMMLHQGLVKRTSEVPSSTRNTRSSLQGKT